MNTLKLVDWSLFHDMFPTYLDYKIPMWSDFKETGSELQVRIVVPGYKKEDFNLYAYGETLFLRIGSESDEVIYSILRRFSDESYQIEKAKAEYRNGILKITIPKISVEMFGYLKN